MWGVCVLRFYDCVLIVVQDVLLCLLYLTRLIVSLFVLTSFLSLSKNRDF